MLQGGAKTSKRLDDVIEEGATAGALNKNYAIVREASDDEVAEFDRLILARPRASRLRRQGRRRGGSLQRRCSFQVTPQLASAVHPIKGWTSNPCQELFWSSPPVRPND